MPIVVLVVVAEVAKAAGEPPVLSRLVESNASKCSDATTAPPNVMLPARLPKLDLKVATTASAINFRKETEESIDCNSVAVYPVSARTKAINSPLESKVTLASLPYTSTMELSPTPQVEAMLKAKAVRNASAVDVLNADQSKPCSCIVMRISEASHSSGDCEQDLQSATRVEPADEDVPLGQALQAVASKLLLHEPLGQLLHEEAPTPAPYFPGAHRMHTLSLA
mmetsp:Transcript_141081/g.351867  ORF Transcript_141081/g.351867 Transcript_141081/m.351867 type:complete len:224 (-) Transcript_141081:647-1318(-)